MFDDIDKVHNAAVGIIITNMIIGLIVFILIACGCIWGCNSVRKNGLKGTINKIWEGPQTNAVVEVYSGQ